jgi:hypothetical protein
VGLEPARELPHRILSPARLPRRRIQSGVGRPATSIRNVRAISRQRFAAKFESWTTRQPNDSHTLSRSAERSLSIASRDLLNTTSPTLSDATAWRRQVLRRNHQYGPSFPAAYRPTATTRKPIWSLRRSGSNLRRKADRQGQPSSAQHPPRRTLEAAVLSHKSGSVPPGSSA